MRLVGFAARLAPAVLVLAALEALGRSGWIDSSLFVPPSAMIAALMQEAQSGSLAADGRTTGIEVLLAFVAGTAVGIPVGIFCWRRPWFGRVFQPYLVALYAMPLVLFYPLLLAYFGLGIKPIVVIGSLMAAVPVALNTTVAFSAIRPTLIRVGRSLGCTRWQLYTKVLLPAATPLIVTGIKMGFIYTLIGVVAMEFVVAQSGLGFAVHYDYNNFQTAPMYGYILFIVVVAIACAALLSAIERSVRREQQR